MILFGYSKSLNLYTLHQSMSVHSFLPLVVVTDAAGVMWQGLCGTCTTGKLPRNQSNYQMWGNATSSDHLFPSTYPP